MSMFVGMSVPGMLLTYRLFNGAPELTVADLPSTFDHPRNQLIDSW